MHDIHSCCFAVSVFISSSESHHAEPRGPLVCYYVQRRQRRRRIIDRAPKRPKPLVSAKKTFRCVTTYKTIIIKTIWEILKYDLRNIYHHTRDIVLYKVFPCTRVSKRNIMIIDGSIRRGANTTDFRGSRVYAILSKFHFEYWREQIGRNANYATRTAATDENIYQNYSCHRYYIIITYA